MKAFRSSLVIVGVMSLLSLAAVSPVSAFPAGANDFSSAPFAVDSGLATENGQSSSTDLTDFDTESGEPSIGFLTSRKTAWWKWTAPETGFCTIDTRPSATRADGVQNTAVGVFTGSSLASLVQVAENDNGSSVSGPDWQSGRASFYAQAGVTYRFLVDGTVTAERTDVILRVRLLPLKTAVRTVTLNGSEIEHKGIVTLTTTSAASFSGKCTIGAKTTAFKGAFNADATCRISIPQKKPANGPQPLPLTLDILAAGDGQLYVLFPDGYVLTTNFPEKVIFPDVTANEVDGYYTAYLQGASGDGYLTLTVKPNGTATGAGILTDGTAYTLSSALYDEGEAPAVYLVPFYKSLYSGKGGLTGNIEIVESGVLDELEGGFGTHLRPAVATSVYYPAGLSASFSPVGGTYRPPVDLGFLAGSGGNGALTLYSSAGESGATVMEFLDFTPANKFIFASSARKPSLSVNVKTGLVTGSITYPTVAPGKKRTIRAVLGAADDTVFLRGQASGTTKTLKVDVQ